MQHLKLEIIVERAVRQEICSRCEFRTKGWDNLGPCITRPCEESCTNIIHLPHIIKIVQEIQSDQLEDYVAVVTEKVCEKICTFSSTSGDFCARRTALVCPLSRYMRDIVDIIEKTLQACSN